MAKQKKSEATGVAIGLGLAAGAAAIAGTYYFYGKDGNKHRKTLKSWSVKARGEVMERLESMTDVTRKNYDAVLAEVLGKYKAVKNIDPKELEELTKELKGHWDAISKTLQSAQAVAHKAAKKPSKK